MAVHVRVVGSSIVSFDRRATHAIEDRVAFRVVRLAGAWCEQQG